MTIAINKIESSSIDIAGKVRVMVSLSDNSQIMLKFQSKPSDTQINAEANKIVYALNNPPAKEPTIDELKQVIVAKDVLLASKEAQIATLSRVVK